MTHCDVFHQVPTSESRKLCPQKPQAIVLSQYATQETSLFISRDPPGLLAASEGPGNNAGPGTLELQGCTALSRVLTLTLVP